MKDKDLNEIKEILRKMILQIEKIENLAKEKTAFTDVVSYYIKNMAKDVQMLNSFTDIEMNVNKLRSYYGRK